MSIVSFVTVREAILINKGTTNLRICRCVGAVVTVTSSFDSHHDWGQIFIIHDIIYTNICRCMGVYDCVVCTSGPLT